MFNDEQRVGVNAEGKLEVKSAATWVTDEEAPDPVVPRVLGEYILVRPIALGNKLKTKSGFELLVDTKTTETKQTALMVGRVIGVGEEAGKRPGVSPVETGDYVLFPKYGGFRMSYQGVKVLFLPDDALLAVIDKEDVAGAISFS